MADEIIGAHPHAGGSAAARSVAADGATPDFLARRMEIERLFGELTRLEDTYRGLEQRIGAERGGGRERTVFPQDIERAGSRECQRAIERILRRAEEIEQLEEALRLCDTPGALAWHVGGPRSDNHESARLLVEAASEALRATAGATAPAASARGRTATGEQRGVA